MNLRDGNMVKVPHERKMHVSLPYRVFAEKFSFLPRHTGIHRSNVSSFFAVESFGVYFSIYVVHNLAPNGRE